MRQVQHEFVLRTERPGLIEFTDEVARWVGAQEIEAGLLTLFVRHTSASLLIQENADADVARDLDDFFRALAPADPGAYRHGAEGPDDMPAHIRSALTQTQLSIPLADGALALGTWQGIFLFEHRDRPHQRRVMAHLIGEAKAR